MQPACDKYLANMLVSCGCYLLWWAGSQVWACLHPLTAENIYSTNERRHLGWAPHASRALGAKCHPSLLPEYCPNALQGGGLCENVVAGGCKM
jgi:hypothetical protein